MRPISAALQARFIAYLKKRTTPSSTHFFCVKWLRFYLDFFEKYHSLVRREASLGIFSISSRRRSKPPR